MYSSDSNLAKINYLFFGLKMLQGYEITVKFSDIAINVQLARIITI